MIADGAKIVPDREEAEEPGPIVGGNARGRGNRGRGPSTPRRLIGGATLRVNGLARDRLRGRDCGRGRARRRLCDLFLDLPPQLLRRHAREAREAAAGEQDERPVRHGARGRAEQRRPRDRVGRIEQRREQLAEVAHLGRLVEAAAAGEPVRDPRGAEGPLVRPDLGEPAEQDRDVPVARPDRPLGPILAARAHRDPRRARDQRANAPHERVRLAQPPLHRAAACCVHQDLARGARTLRAARDGPILAAASVKREVNSRGASRGRRARPG